MIAAPPFGHSHFSSAGQRWPQITATQAATRRSLRRGSCWLQVFTFGVGKSGFSMNQKCFLSHSCKHPILGILVFVISDWNAMIIGTVLGLKEFFFEHQILRSFPWGMSIMTSWPSLPHMDFSHLFLICSRSFTWLRTILSMFHGANWSPAPPSCATAPRPHGPRSWWRSTWKVDTFRCPNRWSSVVWRPGIPRRGPHMETMMNR